MNCSRVKGTRRAKDLCPFFDPMASSKISRLRKPITEVSKVLTTKWDWIVCIAVPFAIVLEAALPHSFGTFVAYFRRTMKLPLAELMWITAITSAIPCILLPITVPQIRRFSKYHRHVSFISFVGIGVSCLLSSAVPVIHWMFLTYTFLYGACSSVLLAVSIVILSDYFPIDHKHHVLATSFYQIGYPIAAALFSPFAAFLITRFSWSRALQIIGLIQLVLGCATSFLFKPYSEFQSVKDDKSVAREDTLLKEDSTIRDGIVSCLMEECTKRPQMFTWFISKYLNYTSWFVLRTTLTPFLLRRGKTLIHTAYIMTTYSIGKISLCVIGAIVGRYLRGRFLLLHFIGSLGNVFCIILWILIPINYDFELFIAFLIGIFVQITLSFGYPASAELLGLEMSQAWTVTNVFAGLGIVFSPLFDGTVFSNQASFLELFFLNLSLWLLQVILHIVTWIIIKFRRPSSLYTEIQESMKMTSQ